MEYDAPSAGGRGACAWRPGPRGGVLLVLLLLLIGEWGLRVVGYPNQVATVTDAQLGWVALPNQDLRVESIPVRINSFGFRDAEWQPLTGPSSVQDSGRRGLRVALLGDSVTYGMGLPEDLRLTEVLARQWGSVAGKRPIHVMNFSMPGYAFDQMQSLYELRVHAWKPDLVIVALNDASHRPLVHPADPGWVHRLLIRSALYQQLQRWTRYRGLRSAPGKSTDAARVADLCIAAPFDPGTEERWTLLKTGLLDLQAEQLAFGGSLLVLALPNRSACMDPVRERVGAFLRPWAETAGIPWVDPMPQFLLGARSALENLEARSSQANAGRLPSGKAEGAGGGAVESLFQREDPEHWTAGAHGLAGLAIYDWMSEALD